MSRPPNTYAIRVTATNVTRLVKAANRAQALRFVADDILEVDLATVDDGIEAGRLGVEVEDATGTDAATTTDLD